MLPSSYNQRRDAGGSDRSKAARGTATTSACSAASRGTTLKTAKRAIRRGRNGGCQLRLHVPHRTAALAGSRYRSGYMHSKYEEYLPIDGHYVYQQTNRMNYFGPLKLKFALVWRLWDTDKKKGGAR